jgi:hypothetical protein
LIPTIPVHVYAWFGRAKKYATADVAELSVSADAFSDLQVFALTPYGGERQPVGDLSGHHDDGHDHVDRAGGAPPARQHGRQRHADPRHPLRPDDPIAKGGIGREPPMGSFPSGAIPIKFSR